MKNNYRIVRFFDTFFGCYGFILQRREKFLWWESWEEVESATVNGLNKARAWSFHYDIPIPEPTEKTDLIGYG